MESQSAFLSNKICVLFEYTHGFGIYHTDKQRLSVPSGNPLK